MEQLKVTLWWAGVAAMIGLSLVYFIVSLILPISVFTLILGIFGILTLIYSIYLAFQAHRQRGSGIDHHQKTDQNKDKRKKEAKKALEKLYNQYSAGKIDVDQLKDGLTPYRNELIELGLLKQKK